MRLKSLASAGLAGILVLLLGIGAHADPIGVWITPFGGYRLSGALNLEDQNFSKIDFADNPVYGLAVGMDVHDGMVEVMWTHQDTHATPIPVLGGGLPSTQFDMKVDQFHFNGLYFMPDTEEHALRPYAMAGLGMTTYNPTGDGSSA